MLFGGSGGESQHLVGDVTSDRSSSAAKALITNQGVLSPDLFFSLRRVGRQSDDHVIAITWRCALPRLHTARWGEIH